MERTGPITKYRTDHDLSLEAFGAILGVNKSTVMRWEDGDLPIERAIEIEKLTGIGRQELRPDIWPVATSPQAAAE